MADIQSLDVLLADFDAERAISPSPVSPADLASLEQELRISLPEEYRDLVLRYDLTKVQVNFTEFSPLLASTRGFIPALREAMRSPNSPFADRYAEWGTVPLGTDWAERTLLVSVRPLTAPAWPQRTRAEPARPYGSIWSFDPEGETPGLEFVASTFRQALHAALFLHVRREDIRDGVESPEALLEAVHAIDPATRGHPYWSAWIAIMR